MFDYACIFNVYPRPASKMASNDNSPPFPIDYQAIVHSYLELALKATGTSLLGKDYNIKDSQKEQFFQNVSINLLDTHFKLFIPSKSYEEINDTDTAFYVKGDPTCHKEFKSNEFELKGDVKAGVPILANVIKLGADVNAFVNKKSSEESIVISVPIPPGAKLR